MAVASQVIIFPFFGVHIRLADNLVIGLWFTLISIVRSYVLRRAFNTYHFHVNSRRAALEECPQCKGWKPGLEVTDYGSIRQCPMCNGKGKLTGKERPTHGSD